MKTTRHSGLFARFLRTRAIHRLFRRVAMLESLAATAVSRDVPEALGRSLCSAARADAQDLLRTLDSHMRNLRHKIEPNPGEYTYIQTVYGVGYRLVGP